MARPDFNALPLAHVVLRIAVGLNRILGAALLGLLAVMFNKPLIISAFGIASAPNVDALLVGMRVIAALGIVAIVMNDAILRRLLAMLATVRDGDPFIASNAARLRAIAWTLLGLQLISIAVALVAASVVTPQYPLRLDAGFSLGGWISVLLTFVLAHVFAQGSEMREELEATV